MVKKMTKLERAKAVGYLAAGWGIKALARELGRAQSSISALAKKVQDLGEERAILMQAGQGRKNLASLAEVKKVIRMAQKDPFITAKTIKRRLGEEGAKFSVRTRNISLFISE